MGLGELYASLSISFYSYNIIDLISVPSCESNRRLHPPSFLVLPPSPPSSSSSRLLYPPSALLLLRPPFLLPTPPSPHRYCALFCSPSAEALQYAAFKKAADAQCGTNASCKAIQTVGICTYDD